MKDLKKLAKENPEVLRVMVLTLPSSRDKALSVTEIQNITGFSYKVARDALDRLIDNGLVLKSTKGLLSISRYYKIGAVTNADLIIGYKNMR